MPGFQSFFSIFQVFVLGKLAISNMRVKLKMDDLARYEHFLSS